MSLTIVWLGSAPPLRTIRWLDGTLATGAKFQKTIAIAAGDPTWLDLACDRATRAGIEAAGVPTDLTLDYLGWAQIVAAVARQLSASTILVDEASRPERFAEVAAIAELLDASQLTSVTALAAGNGASNTLHASRVADGKLHTVRIKSPAVIGLRIPGQAIDDYPTPMPSASMKRMDLVALGLDPGVLAHRALPQKNAVASRRSAERVAEMLALFRRRGD